jgi:hypothetical protein
MLGYFMQDGATLHTAKETIRKLRDVFMEFNGENSNISPLPKNYWLTKFICGENSKVLCMPTIHMTGSS